MEEILAESFSNTSTTPTPTSSPTNTTFADDCVHDSHAFSSLFNYVSFSSVDTPNLPSSRSTSTSSYSTSTFLEQSLSNINIMYDTNTDAQRDLYQHLPHNTSTVLCESSNSPINSTSKSTEHRSIVYFFGANSQGYSHGNNCHPNPPEYPHIKIPPSNQRPNRSHSI